MGTFLLCLLEVVAFSKGAELASLGVNLTQAGATWEGGISVKESLPLDWPVDESAGIFLIGLGGPSPLWKVSPMGKWS